MHTRVKTAKGRKMSSTRWLQRQLNDPYVAAAQAAGYRSRAAFKLTELNEKYGFLKKNMRVVDLGAAPGGWTQVIVAETGAETPGSTAQVVALDLLEMDPVPGAVILTMDFMDDDAPARLKAAMNGPADAVLSDMAPALTGHSNTDHLRIMAAVEAAYLFAKETLTPGGCFIAKVFQGGTEGALLADMKKDFQTVRHAKPPASRAESSEVYVVATGFRGNDTED